jgi:hypothetical protein
MRRKRVRCLFLSGAVGTTVIRWSVPVDYVAWIASALRRKPHLSQAGLARHLKRDRSVVTTLLKGRRRLLASEIDIIASYLGEDPPDRHPSVPVLGRVGEAWHKPGTEPRPIVSAVAPVLGMGERQIAFEIEPGLGGYVPGSIVIGSEIGRRPVEPGTPVVVRERHAGLERLAIARAMSDGAKPIARVIEIRMPVA